MCNKWMILLCLLLKVVYGDLHVIAGDLYPGAPGLPFVNFTSFPDTPVGLPPSGSLLGWNSTALQQNRELYNVGCPKALEAVSGLVYLADDILTQPIYQATNKTLVADSGDPRDYVSIADQWWLSGEYYVRRTSINHGLYDIAPNAVHLQLTIEHVQWLALAWFFTGDEKYAQRARDKVYTWFIDPNKSVTPHMTYAQMIPQPFGAPSVLRPQGIVEMGNIVHLLNGVTMLAESGAWSDSDNAAFVSWLTRYAAWSSTSLAGFTERQSADHHGTWFDVQLIAIYLFVGNWTAAARLSYYGRRRLEYQIVDGFMYYEFYGNERSIEFIQLNLNGWATLSEMSALMSIDTWHYNGSAFKRVYDSLAGYWIYPWTWPYKSVGRKDVQVAAALAPRMYAGYGGDDLAYAAIYKQIVYQNPAQVYMARASAMCHVSLNSSFADAGIVLQRTCWSWKCEYLKLAFISAGSGCLLAYASCLLYACACNRRDAMVVLINRCEVLLADVPDDSDSIELRMPNHEDFDDMCNRCARE